MLDDFEETCECGGTFRFSVEDVAKERTVRCSRGCNVHLRDEGGGAAETDKALRDLDKALDGLGGTINIKF